jgi:hypothetical protein
LSIQFIVYETSYSLTEEQSNKNNRPTINNIRKGDNHILQKNAVTKFKKENIGQTIWQNLLREAMDLEKNCFADDDNDDDDDDVDLVNSLKTIAMEAGR